MTCKAGGGVYRKHNALVRLLGRLLRAAGYQVLEEVWEPRWDRPVRDRARRQKKDREGNLGEGTLGPEADGTTGRATGLRRRRR